MPEPATLALFPWRPPANWAPAPQDAASAGEGAEDDEADDEEAPAPGGFMAPGSTTCIEVSGTVTAGLQRDWYKAGARTNAAGLKPVAATSFPLCASFRIESGQTLENDVEVVTAFEFQTSTASDAYVSRYVLTLPRIGLQPGCIKLDRLAADLVWKPFEGFRSGIEVSIAWHWIELVGRVAAAQLAGRQTSVQALVERAF